MLDNSHENKVLHITGHLWGEYTGNRGIQKTTNTESVSA